MGIIVDLVIVLIFLAYIYFGYKKGLAHCLLRLCATVIAIVLSLILYKPLVNFVVDKTTIDDNLNYSLQQVMGNGNKEENAQIVKEDSGIPKPVVKYINENVAGYAEQEKDKVVTTAAEKTSKIIINLSCMIALYIIITILLKIVIVISDLVSKVPVIKQCNELGGIIYGIVAAFFVVTVILAIVSILRAFIGEIGIVDAIMQSYIGKFLYNNNIILNIIF